MKVRKAGTDIRVCLDFKVGEDSTSEEIRSEYVLPGHQSADPNVIECFIPVKPGEVVRVYGRFYGSTRSGAIDLVADGAFCDSSRIEPGSSSRRPDRIKYHKSRTIDLNVGIANPARDDWKTKTGEPPREVYIGRLQTEALSNDERKALNKLELLQPDHRQPGVGSLMVAVSLAQDACTTYPHQYGSAEVGSWKTARPRYVRDSGIAPDHKLQIVPAQHAQEVKLALPKQSKKFRNHFQGDRVGRRPFCKIIFYFRSQAAIDAAGCVLRGLEAHEELEPAVPDTLISVKDSKGSTLPGSQTAAISSTPPAAADGDEDDEHEADDVVNTTEDHEEPEQPKKQWLLGGRLKLPEEYKRRAKGPLGGKLVLDRPSPIIYEYRNRLSESKSPCNFNERLADFKRRYNGHNSAQEMAAVDESRQTLDHDHQDEAYTKDFVGEGDEVPAVEGQQQAKATNAVNKEDDSNDKEWQIPGDELLSDESLKDESVDNCGSANSSGGWDFSVLDTTLQGDRGSAVPTNDLSDEATKYIAADSKAGIEKQVAVLPHPEYQTPSIDENTISPVDFDKIPDLIAIRTAVPEQGLDAESVVEIFESAGPYQHYDSAMDEFAYRLKQVARKDERTAIYYPKTDPRTATREPTKLPQQSVLREELALLEEPRIPQQESPLPQHQWSPLEALRRRPQNDARVQTEEPARSRDDSDLPHVQFTPTQAESVPSRDESAAPKDPQGQQRDFLELLHPRTDFANTVSSNKPTDSGPHNIKQEETKIITHHNPYLSEFATMQIITPTTDSHSPASTTNTSAIPSKKRKLSSTLTTNAPAKSRKAELDAEIAAIRAQTEAKRRETAALRKAREQKAEEKKARKEQKRLEKAKREQERAEEERHGELLAQAKLEAELADLAAANEEAQAELELETEGSDEESSEESEDDGNSERVEAEMEN